MGLLFSGCVTPITRATVIDESDDRYVKLQVRYDDVPKDRPIRFTHPLRLQEEDWTAVLDGIHVRPRQRIPLPGLPTKEPVPAFADAEGRYLARQFSRAFAQAGSDQWVVFLLSDRREGAVTEMTSGGLYVEDSVVHLLLVNYRQPVSMAHIAQATRADPLKPIGESFYDVVPGPHQTLRSDGHWHLGAGFTQNVIEVAIDYRALLTASGESSVSLEARFQTLQRLHEQGLITDEEYYATRRRLLEAL